MSISATRPSIALKNGVIFHYDGSSPGRAARVVLRKTQISVGCTDITPDALRHLLKEYDKAFPAAEVVLQDGCT